MDKSLKLILISCCLYFLVIETVIIVDGLLDETVRQGEVLIILGSKVNVDGSLSPRLKARLDQGFFLYRHHLIKLIFVSGGLGIEGHYEAVKMKEYLVDKGIPPANILVDNYGYNSRQTALNFREKFSNQTKIVVVSQYFHISRCKLAFKQLGFKHVRGSHARFYEIRDMYATIREFFAYHKYLLYY